MGLGLNGWARARIRRVTIPKRPRRLTSLLLTSSRLRAGFADGMTVTTHHGFRRPLRRLESSALAANLGRHVKADKSLRESIENSRQS